VIRETRVEGRFAVTGYPVILVCLATFLAAAGTLDPGIGSGDTLVREAGGWVVLGLLVLASSHGARTPVRSFLPAAAAAVYRGCLAAILLLPVLAAGWELGASGRVLLEVLAGIVLVPLFATGLGFLSGVLGLGLPVGMITASSITALLLWPGTLQWSREAACRFPGPEAPLWILGPALAVLALASVSAAVLRKKTGESP
jgi:hypothetical protein